VSPVLKFLSFLILPALLGIGSALFGTGAVDVAALSGLDTFFTSSLASSWLVVLGLSLALPVFLSQWIKPVVVTLIYLLASVVLYFLFSRLFGAEQPCYMLSGLYVLLGLGFWVSRSSHLAPGGLEALRWPAPIWVGLVTLGDLLLGYFFGGGTLVHIYMLLAGYLVGMVVGILYGLIAGSMAPRESRTAPVSRSSSSAAASSPATAPGAPVGARPKISVLDMKMAAVVDDAKDSDKSISTAKIFVENQDG
jgi:hypothetical protein